MTDEKQVTNTRALWISGLRRSGTTAIWKMFRDINDVTCYDEPLNPKLVGMLPANHPKKTWDEFINLWHSDRDLLERKLSAVSPELEGNQKFTACELEYLHWLSSSRVVIDFTRINFRLADALEKFPYITILSLFRSPVAFATSHLINSENSRIFRQRFYRCFFFTNLIGYDSWAMERLFCSAAFQRRIEEANVTPRPRLLRLRSYEKLLLIWLVARREAERVAAGPYGDRHFIGSYEDIIDGESKEFVNAVQQSGLRREHLDKTGLRKYSRGFKPDDERWRSGMERAGYFDFEIEGYWR